MTTVISFFNRLWAVAPDVVGFEHRTCHSPHCRLDIDWHDCGDRRLGIPEAPGYVTVLARKFALLLLYEAQRARCADTLCNTDFKPIKIVAVEDELPLVNDNVMFTSPWRDYM